MKYLKPEPFSSKPASKAYRDGWEATFGGYLVQLKHVPQGPRCFCNRLDCKHQKAKKAKGKR